MAITVNWLTKTWFIPQGDLTLVSGTLYEANTETQIRQPINAKMASAEGIVFDDPISHNTEVTVAGTTYARFIEFINGYNVTFTPDSQWSVRLAGSNNNIFDVENGILNQNQVQVIPQNSAGLIVNPTLDAAALWGRLIEGSQTAEQLLALIASFALGELEDAETNAPKFKAAGNNAVTRISATTDGEGNRTSVTLTPP